jgi:DNA-binding XRE family transcriptional regulator
MLLEMTQDELAEKAGIGKATIRRIEAPGNGPYSEEMKDRLVLALERAGIKFLDHDQPGVRLMR